MELRKLKELVNLPNSKSTREVYNHIIGVYFPGGNDLLDICERLHQTLHGRAHKDKDPMLQDLLDKALNARSEMVEAIKKSTDGIFVKL
jgi:hypothetical protein